MHGHLGVGYVTLSGGVADAPGGSLSVGAGLDYPIARALRLGGEVGYALLGTRTVDRGSLIGELDYSVFETVVFLHWLPPSGPVECISVGPGVFNARADLSSSGPAAFGDLAIEQTTGGIGFQITLMKRKPSPVRVGLELGARRIFLEKDDWTLLDGRLSIHY